MIFNHIFTLLQNAKKGSFTGQQISRDYSLLCVVKDFCLLQHLFLLLEEKGFLDQLQTAHQKGISCIDHYLRDSYVAALPLSF